MQIKISTLQMMRARHSLLSVTVVSLDQHYLLCHVTTLFVSAVAKHVAQSGVRLFITVRDPHTPACSNIETRDVAGLIDDGYEPDVVGEDIDVVVGGYGNSYLELRAKSIRSALKTAKPENVLFVEDKTPHTMVLRPSPPHQQRVSCPTRSRGKRSSEVEDVR